LNSSKYKYRIVTLKRKQVSTPTILLEGTPLERADTFKYLGVGGILSSDLSWTPQVESAPKPETLGVTIQKFLQ